MPLLAAHDELNLARSTPLAHTATGLNDSRPGPALISCSPNRVGRDIRAILSWALDNDIEAGARFVARLVAPVDAREATELMGVIAGRLLSALERSSGSSAH